MLDDVHSKRHFGAVLIAIAALSMLSTLSASWIGEAMQEPVPGVVGQTEPNLAFLQRREPRID